MTDFLKTYKPENAAALTPEQIEGLRNLTNDQIKVLAKEYPNTRYHKAYLLIIDTKSKIPIEKQLPSLSTFENLYNLNTKNNMNFVAVGFRGSTKQRVSRSNVRPRRSEVVDLSDAELMDLPGFVLPRKGGGTEVIEPEVVQVVKVNKTEPAKRGRPKKEIKS